MTTLDAQKLSDFYDSPLGEVSRRIVGRVIRSRWANTTGLTIAALGYGLPYLDRFRDRASRCVALMPSQQGAVVWPESAGCASALVWADMLPLPDASIDRLLVAHALEAVERPEALLEEAWRVTAPQGRVIVVAPSRRGIWARADRTPFGQGSPYSRAQLRELFNHAILSPVFWGEALYFPPIARNYVIRSASAIERVGAALRLPFAGVHVVEAIKQVHRPVGTHAVARSSTSAATPRPAAPNGASLRVRRIAAPDRDRASRCGADDERPFVGACAARVDPGRPSVDVREVSLAGDRWPRWPSACPSTAANRMMP